MIEDLKKRFIQEANEYAEEIENSLLQLEQTPDDMALIETIFRAMHTLKGAGAMFGFNSVSDLTHHLESIYDSIRNNKTHFSSDIASITLEAIDIIKDLLSDTASDNTELQERYSELLETIKIQNCSDNKNIQNSDKQAKNCGISHYIICFSPSINLYDNGTNPLFILDELSLLGKTKIFCNYHKIPEYELLNPEKCYLEWIILLETDKDKTTIKDTFLFVEDTSYIEIINVSEKYCSSFQDILQISTTLYNEQSFLTLSKITEKLVPIKKHGNGKHKDIKKQHFDNIRVDSSKLDILMNLVSELVTT
ncbi:MAG: Hpt domain-containing protein, partial [Bacteroidales bacterium]